MLQEGIVIFDIIFIDFIQKPLYFHFKEFLNNLIRL